MWTIDEFLDLPHRFASSIGEIAFTSIGEGPDVVLVHGTPANSIVWHEVVARLRDRFRLHLLDLPGYGKSEKFEGQDVRLRSLARALSEWLESLDLGDPVLVGHDFGAAAVLGAHLQHGYPAAAICISDGVVLSPWGTAFSRHVKDHEAVFSDVPEYVHRAMLQAHLATAMTRAPSSALVDALLAPWLGPDGQQAYYRHVGQFEYEFTDQLETLYPALGVPMLILWGEDDGWVHKSEAYRLQELIPHARVRLLPDAGHFAMVDTPGLFSRYLADWLDDLPIN